MTITNNKLLKDVCEIKKQETNQKQQRNKHK